MSYHLPGGHTRKQLPGMRDDEGAFLIAYTNQQALLITKASILTVVATRGDGWEHVSVSLTSRCPTWDEMNYVKDLFWEAEDCVVQYHPPKSEYVNVHPFCLHLWREIGHEFRRPPPC